MKPSRWSDIRAQIEKDGGPITPHPDAETMRLLAENTPRERNAVEYKVARLEPPLDTGEDPPVPIPARPYLPPEPVPIARPRFRSRLWAALTRRAA